MTVLPHLSDLGKEHGTDKYHLHNYTEFYHELLSPLRRTPLTFLEIGVDGGESIRMWDAFFTHPSARIYGVDIHDKGVSVGEKGKFILGDASQPNFIFDLVNATGVFDVVLDDGSHYSDQQKRSLSLLWPYVKSGGLYICEDTHSSYHYPWTPPEEVSFVSHMMEWIHKLNENGAGHCGKPTETDIEEIVFRKSLVVIKKR